MRVYILYSVYFEVFVFVALQMKDFDTVSKSVQNKYVKSTKIL
jgi:hypothetical protein